MIITCISDTHTKHKQLTDNMLPGGDLLIHSGDFSSVGYAHEIANFCAWFNSRNYTNKVFIAGNHDLLFENHPEKAADIVNNYPGIKYLQDQATVINDERPIKIYGSPWQPEFCHWGFNLPRNGSELLKVWNDIPEDTDILITHGPPSGTLDMVDGRNEQLGCAVLQNRLLAVKPKIHIFGHIHSGYGYYFDGTTHYFNASVLNERYAYEYKPQTFDWDPLTNTIKFL